MAEENSTVRTLPAGVGEHSSGLWGMVALIVTEAALFGYLLFSYFYLASQTESSWPPAGLPSLFLPTVNMLILMASSAFMWACERCMGRRQPSWSLAAMSLAFALGVCFVVIQLHEWRKQNYDITSHLYGSLYFTITGFHMLHVFVGLVILFFLLLWIALGYFDDKRHAAVTIGGLYWHFVNATWLLVFSALYLSPYLFEIRI